MSIEYYMLHAATAIAQVPGLPGDGVVYIPATPGSIVVSPATIFSLILPTLIFLGIWTGAWWRIVSRVGYQGQIRLLWLIGLLLFPINAIVMIAFALLPWPKSTEPRSIEPQPTQAEG